MPVALTASPDPETTRVPLVRGAMMLQMTRERLLRLIQVGRVKGGQDDGRHWYVLRSEVDRLLAERVAQSESTTAA